LPTEETRFENAIDDERALDLSPEYTNDAKESASITIKKDFIYNSYFLVYNMLT
jgi:hypothetical protein